MPLPSSLRRTRREGNPAGSKRATPDDNAKLRRTRASILVRGQGDSSRCVRGVHGDVAATGIRASRGGLAGADRLTALRAIHFVAVGVTVVRHVPVVPSQGPAAVALAGDEGTFVHGR